MTGIASFSGLASGVQWADLVDQMINLERVRKVTPLTDQVQAAQNRKDAWSSYESLLSKLNTAAAPIRDQSAFGILKTSATTSPIGSKTLISSTAGTSAVPGSYQVEVIKLAKADKLSGGSFSSTSTQLSISGEFYVNGRAVTLDGTESLTAIRDKINATNSGSTASGVTATILSTSSTQHRLVLTADATGARGVELADGGSNTLESLGIVSSSTSLNTNPADSSKTDSFRFTSKTTALADMLGVTAPPATTTVVIDGRKITVDLENDTLISLMNKVTTAGGTAEIVEEEVNGTTFYRLSATGTISADGTASDPTASQELVELTGFVQKDRASSITTGQDATFKIDGFKMTRRTNTVSDAITDVTLNLLTANGSDRTSSVTGANLSIVTDPKSVYAGSYDISIQDTAGTITGATINGEAAVWDAATQTITGASGGDFDGLVLSYTGAATTGSVGTLTVSGDIAVTLDVQRDLDATVTKMNAFANAYNAVVDFYDKQRGDTSAPLYSNGSFRSMQRSVTNALLTSVSGLPSGTSYTSGSIAGVALDEKGKLAVDADTLKSALTTSLNDVKALFGTGGTSTNGQVSFVAGTSASEPGTYAVNITAAATLGTHLSSVWAGNYSASDGVSDTLQITDSNSGITVDFVALEGMTLSEAVTELTELFEGQGLNITASAEGGALRLTSSEYGTASTFTLSGATAAARLGVTEGTYAGTDVAGTIGGLAATGAGQVLTGDADLTTEGLAVRYTGSTTGSMGSVSYVLGVTGNIDRIIEPYVRIGDGVIASQMTFIDTSVEKLNKRVDDTEARIELRRLSLEQQFIRMEESLSMLNSQGTWLSGQISAMQGNSNNN